jgi:arylsulfatase
MVAGAWKATTDHVSKGVQDEEELLEGSRDFRLDRWSLFKLDEDFSEAHDLADLHPEIVTELEQQWEQAAERNGVRPMSDGLVDRLGDLATPAYPAGQHVVIYPDGGPVSDEALPMLFGGGRLVAEVEVPDAPEGVLFALGDWSSGICAFVAGGRLCAALALPGASVLVQAEQALTAGPAQLGCQLRTNPSGGCDLDLLVDQAVIATASSPIAIPLAWQHGGTSITLGHDRGLPVTDAYTPPFSWNGLLHRVVIDAGHYQPPAADVVRVALEVD